MEVYRLQDFLAEVGAILEAHYPQLGRHVDDSGEILFVCLGLEYVQVVVDLDLLPEVGLVKAVAEAFT